MTSNHKDQIYADTLGDPGLFTFNETVVGVFPDMINRSVPGYATVIAMTGLLASRYARPNTRIYDLGCSLGASLRAVANAGVDHSCQLIGIDNSPAMIEEARVTLADLPKEINISLDLADIADIDIANASVVIMNYTLQFVPVAQRHALMRKIRAALSPGDALILSEKISLSPEAMDHLMINLHHDFKRAQGYSDLEIAAKRQSLENVLIPETRETHRQRLLDAGFSHCDCWFQCFNFVSFIAIA